MRQARVQDPHLLTAVTFVQCLISERRSGCLGFSIGAARARVCPLRILNLYRPVIFEPCECCEWQRSGICEAPGGKPLRAL